MTIICLKLTTETLEKRRWLLSGVLIVNFEHISHLVLVFLGKLRLGITKKDVCYCTGQSVPEWGFP